MSPLLISVWCVGAVLLLASIVYFFIDYNRTGKLFRVKMPMMVVGLVGGLLVVGSVFSGIALH